MITVLKYLEEHHMHVALGRGVVKGKQNIPPYKEELSKRWSWPKMEEGPRRWLARLDTGTVDAGKGLSPHRCDLQDSFQT